MNRPSVEALPDPLEQSEFPPFTAVRYEPPAPREDAVEATTRRETSELVDELPSGATIAVGLGSRGIHDIESIAPAVIDAFDEQGFDPVVVPAMGSHGGATAEGQRRTLAALSLTEETLGCPIDARMETETVGQTSFGEPVYFSTAALEADAVTVINRVKPHTNFAGEIESGLCKMLTIGLGKRNGAQSIHEQALVHGYVPVIEDAFGEICETVRFLGGIAIVENFYDRTAAIEGITAVNLPHRESELLVRAQQHLPTLPYDTVDVLIVDRIGKDISGTGMDTNVVGRYQVLNTDEPETPDIKRIVVRGLTEETHGNGHGIGLADITTTEVIDELDLEQMYTNALTSNSLKRSKLPVAMPNEQLALSAAFSTVGTSDPESVRAVWLRDTGHLSSFAVSEALANESYDHVDHKGQRQLVFCDGKAALEP